MLIKKADSQAKAEIYQLWKTYFAFDDEGYTDYYFTNVYDQAASYLLLEKGEIISCLQVLTNTMTINQEPLKYDFVVGVVTKQEYRHQGCFKLLWQTVVTQLCSPVVLLDAYQPEIYHHLGFSDLYYHKRITVIPREMDLSTFSFEKASQAAELLQLYQEFCADKNGARQRDVAYYRNKAELFTLMKRETVIIKRNGLPQGYFVFQETAEAYKIEELIYTEKEVAQAAMHYFAGDDKAIEVRLSADDDCLQAWTVKEEALPATQGLFLQPDIIDKADFEKKRLFFNEYD